MEATNSNPRSAPAETQPNPIKPSSAIEALRMKLEAQFFEEWERQNASLEVAQVIEKTKKQFTAEFYKGLEKYGEVEYLKMGQYHLEQKAGKRKSAEEEDDEDEDDGRSKKRSRQS
jgi:hypothetical protein